MPGSDELVKKLQEIAFNHGAILTLELLHDLADTVSAEAANKVPPPPPPIQPQMDWDKKMVMEALGSSPPIFKAASMYPMTGNLQTSQPYQPAEYLNITMTQHMCKFYEYEHKIPTHHLVSSGSVAGTMAHEMDYLLHVFREELWKEQIGIITKPTAKSYKDPANDYVSLRVGAYGLPWKPLS